MIVFAGVDGAKQLNVVTDSTTTVTPLSPPPSRTGYDVAMGTKEWLITLGFFLAGLYPLLSAFFPELRIKWGGRMGPGYPMSTAGKLSAAAFPIFVALMSLLTGGKPGVIGFVVWTPLLILAMCFAVRDKRRFLNQD